MPRCARLRLGAPAGAAMAYTRRAGEGCAGRLTAGRHAARPSLTLVPRRPPRARGARYALGDPEDRGVVSIASERVGEQAA